MTDLTDVVGRVLRGMFKLALLALTLVFLLGLLLIGVVGALFILLWSLLTGRKPALWTSFKLFSEATQQFRPPAAAQVVDVQAHEVGGQETPAQYPVPQLTWTDEASGTAAPPNHNSP